LQELRRNFDQKNGENANLNVKIKNLESHLKTVREELQNTLQMRNTRKKELDTEKHFTVVSEHENSRLSQLSRSLEKQLEQLREQRNIFENKIYQTNSKVEQLKNQMQWDQHALEAWLEESARRDEDALIFQKYRKQDNSKIKVQILDSHKNR
jgi:outer membrane murein-binding lipoprotein Lpp